MFSKTESMFVKKSSDFPANASSANPVYYRTYSRFDNGTRESWGDTCARVVDGIAELGKFTDEEKALVYRNVRSQKCLPSGRWLWIGGTEWSKQPANYYGNYNCLTGDTLVSTLEYGAVEISFLEGKTVNVINRNGEWSKATFSRFPDDEIYEITLRRGVASEALKTIRATGNHRWFPSSANGNAVSTIELKPKDELKVLTAPRPDDTTESYRLGVQHGVVFGDGSVQGSKPHERLKYKVRLCNEKKELLPHFEGRKVLYCPSYKGDPLVMINKDDFIDFVPDGNLKQLPTTTDVSYLLGFVRGLFATDGCIGERNGSLSALVSGTLETGLWLETIIPSLGFENGTLRCVYEAGQISNYGSRKKALYSLHIYIHSLSSNDLLRSKHRAIFEKNISNAQKPIWRVLDVQKLDTKEAVFCCEEPITHGFSLTGGIETGNCFSAPLNSWNRFALSMNLAMQGCGTGSVVEEKYINQLPTIINRLDIIIIGEIGRTPKADRKEDTEVKFDDSSVYIKVGDSRQGWVDSYQTLLELSSNENLANELLVTVDISDVRPKGEKLKGFGGIANPIKLADLYPRLASILNNAVGRKLNSLECILIADEALKVVVAGNIRRAASIKQGSSTDELFLTAKDNLWQQNELGQWTIDDKRDALRMSNHTRLFHKKPTKEECIDSVRKQFYSGEGAIGWMGEAVARCNVDLLQTDDERLYFLSAYNHSTDYARDYLLNLMLKKQVNFSYQELEHRINRYGANPCYEIQGNSFMCNLSEVHLNQIDPLDFTAQTQAFKAGGLWVAPLLTHKFEDKELQYSRELDPIVGVGLTGLFDFFVNALGIDWLEWWQAGRPEVWQGDNLEYYKIKEILDYFNCSESLIDKELDSTIYKLVEKLYLEFWSEVAHDSVWEYCDRHNLKRPNRCTTIKPSGSLSLLTGASPGWHPPKVEKGGYFIRRITYGKNDPVALACIDYGYNVVPSQSDKDENGVLLNDPYDSRCTEWLVEIPSKVAWADLPGVEEINVSKFSALAQFDFAMQCQKYYVKHNCFARNTEFLTDMGVKTFEEFEVGDKVKVLNANGDWSESEIVNTGLPRTMYEIVLRQGSTGKLKTIVATDCHRFPVKRASGGNSKISIKTTLELKPGHRFVTNVAEMPEVNKEAVKHGLTFGDGAMYKNSHGHYYASQLYLCHGKRELITYFMDNDRVYERDDWNQTRIYGLPLRFKELPSEHCSQEYFAGFLAGLLASDGNICESTITISTNREDVVTFLYRHCPRLGISITNHAWFESSSYKKGSGVYQVTFSKETFPENLVLRTFHQENLDSKEYNQPRQWRVVSVTELQEKQTGWCVMEPETNHFTLTQNILVMNTSATLELSEAEIEPLGERIYEAIRDDEGYISAALLARFESLETYPRLPFESCTKEEYEVLNSEVLARRKVDNFHDALIKHDKGLDMEVILVACDGGKCELKDI